MTKMILHVVGGEEEFIAEPARDVEHEEFFLGRIKDTDVDPVYSFNPTSRAKEYLEKVASGNVQFEPGAQELSREFSRQHVGSSTGGAFFIFELGCDDPDTRLYSLIKYDYSEALEQTKGNAGSMLRKIVTAFIADRKAIQKSAIIRVVDGAAEDAISARDRAKPSPAISDYFATFLDVKRTRTDEELNKKVVDVLRETFRNVREMLPERNVARAFAEAKAILRNRQEITEDAISDAVLAAAGNPQDEETRVLLQRRTRGRIKAEKIEGLVFPPDPNVLKKPATRRLHTTEGITVIYPDDIEGATIRRDKNANGGETITIQTAKVMEDEVVRDPTRANA